MTETTNAPVEKKPRVALWIATGFGLGYLPIAPGTWGSLGGVALSWWVWNGSTTPPPTAWVYPPPIVAFLSVQVVFVLLVISLGVWAAERAAQYLRNPDPGSIVIDEISGQQIAYFGLLSGSAAGVGWKSWLLGFILFRIFDIVKPPPARQAEKWPHGWGIMADDWFAGMYAAIVLWLVRWTGWLG
jgi:phosphatidylglycerophosphatase A